ncbi:SH3 domain-containing protein [Desulfolutivibrio sulfoxidireducens]|uniref:SH3 domain-containing protein n=1 Tax=Desulfolutivibrio sulfoxidireducens TaxID=2773299 RepID=UPI00159D9238|nr:SH3 domain-containing protein [Desulfolutivibrio sulfoxidireducens]QLA15991.1 SH3 domain-containing protein [Desulfolutivibrio sulfoxidireducens]QLA20101.1 SH3 domain-containing protein [Desulfolutivibrio sulfoxidireducens]
MNYRKILVLSCLAVVALFTLGCQVSVDAPPRTVVVVEEARTVRGTAEVRTCPSVKCDIVGTVYRGWNVRILSYRGDYAEVVVVNSGVRGWMNSRMLY